MAFLNTNNLPPLGYSVFVAETGFQTTKYTGLEATVKELQAHRKANPRFGWATDGASVQAWVLAYTEARLRQTPGGEAYLVGPTESPPANFSFPRRLPHQRPGVLNVAGGSVVEKIKNTVAGIGLWFDFFGDGPVKPELAAARAATCVRCPLNNREGNFLQRFNEASAKEITAIFGSLKHLNLSTPHDDMLGVCDACDCPNKSNVFTPLEIKLKHLRPEARAKLDPGCWVLSEERVLST
jgi:hypothetical protein